jgi:hypothetical protein
MEDIYILNKEGLQVKASTLSLVHSQLFYVLAEGSNGEVKIFKDTTECASYFNTSPQNINLKLAKELPVVKKSDGVGFVLSRKPL